MGGALGGAWSVEEWGPSEERREIGRVGLQKGGAWSGLGRGKEDGWGDKGVASGEA